MKRVLSRFYNNHDVGDDVDNDDNNQKDQNNHNNDHDIHDDHDLDHNATIIATTHSHHRHSTTNSTVMAILQPGELVVSSGRQ